jgi:hypothetical protein
VIEASQTIHTTLTMTNHYASLNVKQLQQSHDLYSPLRAKDTGVFDHLTGGSSSQGTTLIMKMNPLFLVK